MKFEFIDDANALAQYCERIKKAQSIAFDTEFVSEDCFRPELCLIQVSADGELALIDGIRIPDCGEFWRTLFDCSAELITHAARAEFLFAYHATGKTFSRLFDVQIGAGLAGLEYPLSYSSLVLKLLNKSVGKTETRSDWRRRPLNQAQIEYALQDVAHLPPIHRSLTDKLDQLGRGEWMKQEMLDWQAQIIESEVEQPWRRLSGYAGLSRRGMAIAIGLWHWRDQSAERRNTPARRVLRDDLLVELARRETSSLAQIKMLRGLERRNYTRDLPEISSAIDAVLQSPKESWPQRIERRANVPDLTLLGQFLYSALSVICRDLHLSTALVGTVQDVRRLAGWYLKLEESGDIPPRLARGWRGKIVGTTIQDMLHGQWAMAIDQPLEDQPLRLIPCELPQPRDSE